VFETIGMEIKTYFNTIMFMKATTLVNLRNFISDKCKAITLENLNILSRICLLHAEAVEFYTQNRTVSNLNL
jgi:hypothetical protein